MAPDRTRQVEDFHIMLTGDEYQEVLLALRVNYDVLDKLHSALIDLVAEQTEMNLTLSECLNLGRAISQTLADIAQ